MCVYTHTYLLVCTILCKLEDVFEMRSDEHKTTRYLDVAEVRCYKLKSSNIYIYFIGTYCVIGITLCSTNESTYMISCDYVRGCGRENCSYTLTSMNKSLTNTIQGSSLIRITDQDIIYHLTVTDMDEFVVQSEELSYSDVESCPTTG